MQYRKSETGEWPHFFFKDKNNTGAVTSGLIYKSYRVSRSALLHHAAGHEKEGQGGDLTWADQHDGHDSEYLLDKHAHHQNDETGFGHASKHEAEQHALKSAAGAGKHAAAAAEKAAHKHADKASALGKDAHEASGWGKHGKGYHNDAHGSDAHEHGSTRRNGWGNNFYNSYGLNGDKHFSKGLKACCLISTVSLGFLRS
ncbi:unnamed protein product [Gongylonema pulchrum]|uniref:Uncharacterized protein n=1 Tax=Gongylonema pulchrum TaxID=637853 RepID=A0A3P7RG24_9BILA|nr:unnamed protein product [Gongylonema pulchrum]